MTILTAIRRMCKGMVARPVKSNCKRVAYREKRVYDWRRK